MNRDTTRERLFYLSWVDKRTDPFPQHESIPVQAGASADIGGRHVSILPAAHKEWPGVPFLEQAEVPVADGRMGVFTWPGLPFEHEGRPGRLYLGPTLSALLHPASRFKELASLDGIFLLYPAKSTDGAPQRLEQLCRQAYAARGANARELDRIH